MDDFEFNYKALNRSQKCRKLIVTLVGGTAATVVLCFLFGPIFLMVAAFGDLPYAKLWLFLIPLIVFVISVNVIWHLYYIKPPKGAVDRQESLCTNCDYNLTDNTTGLCPECGEQISPYQQRRLAKSSRDNDLQNV